MPFKNFLFIQIFSYQKTEVYFIESQYLPGLLMSCPELFLVKGQDTLELVIKSSGQQHEKRSQIKSSSNFIKSKFK